MAAAVVGTQLVAGLVVKFVSSVELRSFAMRPCWWGISHSSVWSHPIGHVHDPPRGIVMVAAGGSVGVHWDSLVAVPEPPSITEL